jgi:hypothetical protein
MQIYILYNIIDIDNHLCIVTQRTCLSAAEEFPVVFYPCHLQLHTAAGPVQIVGTAAFSSIDELAAGGHFKPTGAQRPLARKYPDLIILRA